MTAMPRYVAFATLRASALAAAAMTGLFSLLEFVEQLASVGQGRYHVADALFFVLLTAPSRLLQVAPASLLIGCLLALGGMARNAELAAMGSLGFSERRIVASVLALVVPLTLVLFGLMEFVIPPAQQLAREQRAAALAADNEAGYWMRHDRQYLNVQRFERGNVAVGIALYGFAPDGSLATVIEADRATIEPDGTWRLVHVSRRRIHDWQIETDHLPALAWHAFVSPATIRFLVVPLDSVAPTILFRHVASLPPDQKAPRDEQVLWTEASLPLALAAMVMAAAPFVFGARGGHRHRVLARPADRQPPRPAAGREPGAGGRGTTPAGDRARRRPASPRRAAAAGGAQSLVAGDVKKRAYCPRRARSRIARTRPRPRISNGK